MSANRKSNSAVKKPATGSQNPVVKSRRVQRTIFLITLLIALLIGIYLTDGPSRTLNHFAESEIALGNFDSAQGWLAISTRLAPKNTAAQLLSARVARHQGDASSLSRHLRTASKLGADPSRVRIEELLTFAQSGRLNEVEAELTNLLASGDPDAAEICDAYANGLAKESRFEEALTILQAWSTDRPNDVVPYYRIARIKEHLQKAEDAKVHYAKAIALNSQYYPAVYSLARIHLDENNTTDAVRYFESCLTMRNPLAAKTGLAMSLVKQGEIERATSLFLEVMSADPVAVRSSYAAVNEPLERNVAACELGKLYVSDKKLEEALNVLNTALQDNPRDLSARYTRAIALKGLHRDDAANKDFELVAKTKAAMERVNVLRNKINRDEDDVDARLELGQLLIEFESERNGLFWLRSALQVRSDSSSVHRALADYYAQHATESAEYKQLADHHREELNKIESRESKTQSTSSPPER